MKKILQFYGEGNVGGGQQRAQYHLIKTLSKNQNIKIGCAFTKHEGYYIEKIKSLNVEVIHLNIKSGFDLGFSKEVVNKLKKYNIHHLHDPSPNVIIYSLLAGKNTKRVFTRRGGIAKYGFDIKKQIKFILKKILLKKYFDGYSGNSFNAVRSVKQQYGIKKDIYTLYNGSDFNDIVPDKPKDEIKKELGLSNEFIIGATGRLVTWKRFGLLIDAFALISDQNVKLLIVGNGPEMKALKELSKKYNIENKIIFTGTKEKIGNYLQAMDAFVLASDDSESFGNSVVEAMAMGIPSVIMEDAAGLKEHIDHLKTGYIAKDSADLSKILVRIKNNYNESSEIASNARTYVREKYSYDNLTNDLLKFYDKVLAT